MVSRRKKIRSLLDYKPDPKVQDEGLQAAMFLVWAATELPYRYIPMPIIVRMARGVNKTYRHDSPEVELFKNNRFQRVKRIILEQYGRETDWCPGVGYRATVDSDDTIETAWKKRLRDIVAAFNRAKKTGDTINLKELTKKNRKYFEQTHGVVKKMSGPSQAGKLLPPDVEDEDEGKKKKKAG